jgi:hypothetical protein
VDLKYERYDGYSPIAVSWSHGGERIVREFPSPIWAVWAEPAGLVVVERQEVGKLQFYALDGSLAFERDIPDLPGYSYWGLNPSSCSKSGVALLFNPVDENVGNEWRDTEQYELLLDGENLVGQRLGIWR